MDNIDKDLEKLKTRCQKLEKLNQAKQYMLDEAIEMMESIKTCMHDLIHAIKLHKFNIEDGKESYSENQKLWDIIEDDRFLNW